ncbi:MAG: TlpA family protein disulfide reductase [Candidatus Hermodarchaeota archaeon]
MKDKFNPSIQELKSKTTLLNDYLEKTRLEWGAISPKPLVQSAIQTLFELLKQKDCVIIAFSASWCKDCKIHLPAVFNIKTALLREYQYELEVFVFSGLKFDKLNPASRWKIPPSPPEVLEFDIFALPTFILLDKQTGKEIGRIEEHPQHKKTIEEELVLILS